MSQGFLAPLARQRLKYWTALSIERSVCISCTFDSTRHWAWHWTEICTQEMEVDKKVAERRLKENAGNLSATLASFL